MGSSRHGARDGEPRRGEQTRARDEQTRARDEQPQPNERSE